LAANEAESVLASELYSRSLLRQTLANGSYSGEKFAATAQELLGCR